MRQQRQLLAAAGRDQRARGLGFDQRHVAVEDQRGAARRRSSGTACCTAWPVPSCGTWRTKARPGAARRWLHLVGAMAGDDHGARRLQRHAGIQHMLQ